MRFFFLLFFFQFIFNTTSIFSQKKNGVIKGLILNKTTRLPIPFANIVVFGSNIGGTSNVDGEFIIENAPLGYQKLLISIIGFEKKISEDFLVTINKPQFIEIELLKKSNNLDEIVIQDEKFKTTIESPLSLQSIGVEEIERNPGGNRDISKIIQSLPGVASSVSFRNDIIIRGGSPSENKFYLDEVEVPVINHFQTQGSSGGPVGIINVNLIKNVSFYSSAFPSNRGNTLSSIFEFSQKEGNHEKWKNRATLGFSDIGYTLEGPINEKTTFIGSVRQSYLQALFKILKLPFLPKYTDFQLNINTKLNTKNQIKIIGLGAYDISKINKSVNDNISNADIIEQNQYIINNFPENKQWNYTFGIVYKHFRNKSFQTFVLSRNELSNTEIRYFPNTDRISQNISRDYNSKEIENKFRFENTFRSEKMKITTGVNADYQKYTNHSFFYKPGITGSQKLFSKSKITFINYSLFNQISYSFFNTRLNMSFGFRINGNSFNNAMSNPIQQFSPRISASYKINEFWAFNLNIGKYFQLPAFTILGYQNMNKEYSNQKNNVTFIQAKHFVTGIQYIPTPSLKITSEFFLKIYNNYPFSVNNKISIANLGSNFGVVGNEEVVSTSSGRAFGYEFLAQKKISKNWYGIFAYTLVRSEFNSNNTTFYPSSWDSKHLISITCGKKFKKNYELGLKWRYVDGVPYTPDNVYLSSIKSNWNSQGRATLDYTKINKYRLPNFHQLDIRIDKIWFFSSWTINLYLDIQNLYNFKSISKDILLPVTDSSGNYIEDSNDSNLYKMKYIKNTNGTILPTIGFIIDF